MELILVRHGETESNRNGTYLGWTDADLNEAGLRQAELLRSKLADEPVSGFFCSPLKRAAKTAEIINREHNLDIVYKDNLKERSFGIWDNLTWEEISGKYPSEYELWKGDWAGYRMENGESAVQVYGRVTAFVDELTALSNHGVFLIVTHLGCISAILAYLLGMGMEGAWRFRVDNGSLTRIVINDEKYAYLTRLNA
jgi:alpha-ribazole phosphatase